MYYTVTIFSSQIIQKETKGLFNFQSESESNEVSTNT